MKRNGQDWALGVVAALPGMEPGAVVPVRPALAAFAVGLTMAMGLFTGLWPGLRGSRADVQSALRDNGAGVSGGRRQVRSLHALVVGRSLWRWCCWRSPGC